MGKIRKHGYWYFCVFDEVRYFYSNPDGFGLSEKLRKSLMKYSESSMHVIKCDLIWTPRSIKFMVPELLRLLEYKLLLICLAELSNIPRCQSGEICEKFYATPMEDSYGPRVLLRKGLYGSPSFTPDFFEVSRNRLWNKERTTEYSNKMTNPWVEVWSRFFSIVEIKLLFLKLIWVEPLV